MSTAVDMQHDTTEPPKRGRKPTPAPLRREQCNFRLPQWLIEWVDAQPEGRGEVIEAALIKAHKLKPPSAAGASAERQREYAKKWAEANGLTLDD